MTSEYFNRKSNVLVTAPNVEVVTVNELKTALRIDDTAEDDLIKSYIKTARISCEQYTGRAFISQTHKLTMDSLTTNPDPISIQDYYTARGDYIEVPIKPLKSITTLITYAPDDSASTYSAANYNADTASGRLYLDTGQAFPTNLRNRNAVELTYIAGYGDNPKDVPEALKQAIMLYAAQLYESRGMCEMSCSCKTLLDPYRILDSNWLC